MPVCGWWGPACLCVDGGVQHTCVWMGGAACLSAYVCYRALPAGPLTDFSIATFYNPVMLQLF